MPLLRDVFGITTSVPRHTYVDRANLDDRLQFLLRSDRHIVIHGPSRQGKTILRRKCLPDSDSLVVRGGTDLTRRMVYAEILRRAGTRIPKEFTNDFSLFSGPEDLRLDPVTLGFVIDEIAKMGRRVILEDFHYLPEDEKKRIAFDMKAFWDAGVFFVVIGVWAEQNLLSLYNGDLAGRVEEIDVQWTTSELSQVLTKGEVALNFSLSSDLRAAIVSDAQSNVGLLQRIAERVCLEAAVTETLSKPRQIEDQTFLERARSEISKALAPRYKQFAEAVARGFKGYEESSLRVYELILRVVLDSTDEELITGLHRDSLLKRVQGLEPRVRLSDLSSALNRLERLQVERSISPLVLSYNELSRKIQLVDREFLFFRRHGVTEWAWA